MSHPRFLPLFFSILAVVFAVAVAVRINILSSSRAPMSTEHAAAMIPERDTGTVVDATAARTVRLEAPAATATTRNATGTPRERRYEELLRTASPAPAPAPVPATTTNRADEQKAGAETPSVLSRIVAPIAEALGVDRKPKEATTSRAAAPQNVRAAASTPSASDGSGSGTGSGESTDTTASQLPADAEEDVTPPQLMSIEFVPPEIKDGESTTVGIVATDNISTVRSVSGVIVTPTGAIQGFSCQRDASNRFMATIAVPADAAEGEWNVKLLTLTDSASNTVTLNRNLGTMPPGAGFRVVSRSPDEKGPVLNGAWLQKASMNAGERNTLFVDADDDRGGVAQVSGVLISPARQARIGFGCQATTGNQWQCVFTAPACVDCGVWKLQQIQLQDKAGNVTSFRADNKVVGAVQVEIGGERCDANAPMITSLQFEPAVISNSEDNIVRVRAVAQDDGCGAASISGQVAPKSGAGGQRASFALESGDGTNFTGVITIRQHAATGIWTVVSLQTLDRAQNLRVISASDPVIANAIFRVE